MTSYEGYGIVLTGYAADTVSLTVLTEKKEELRGYYSDTYLSEGRSSVENGLRALQGYFPSQDNIIYNGAVGREGIFRALWQMGEELNCGLRVRLDKIAIRQIAIEMSDYFDYNPYMADSTGCRIIVCDNEYNVISDAEERGIMASVIGYVTGDNDRLIINNEEKRYLTP